MALSTLQPLPLWKTTLYCVLALCIVIALEQYTNLDLVIQRLLYNETSHTWYISQDEHKRIYTLYFYKGLKSIFIGTGVCLLVALLFFWKRCSIQMRGAIIEYLLALIFVPLCIASLKKITNTYCPNQLTIFDGMIPYVRLLESYPITANAINGRCFPAGHATVGFFLFIVYFCTFTLQKQRFRFYGVLLGCIVGGIAGFYQMVRGEHFLSHTLVTMILAWLCCAVIHTLCTQCLHICCKKTTLLQ